MGKKLLEMAKEHAAEYDAPIILAKVNGKLAELRIEVEETDKVEFITTKSEIGCETYRRSVCMMMLAAMHRIVPKDSLKKVCVEFSISKGYYCHIEANFAVDEAFLERVRSEMKSMVAQDLPFHKRSTTTDEAIRLFHEYKMYDKEKLFKYRRVSKVNIYELGGFENYHYGYMAPSTGMLGTFELYPYEKGFVIQLPIKKVPGVVPEFEPQKQLFQVRMQSAQWGRMLGVRTVGDLNDVIARGGITELMLVQEAIQEKKVADIAAEIASKPEKKFIMIAGPSSSGKTTFSHRLSVQLRAHGLKPHPIEVDNYFVEREDTPLDENGNYNFECIEAIDLELFNQQMQDLMAGKMVEMPKFNFKTGKKEYKGDYLTLKSDEILVVEGIHCLNDRLTYSISKDSKYKIYISALTQLNVDEHNRIPSTDGRLIRRIVRDARTRGSDAKRTLGMWESVGRGEEAYIFPFQEDADVMFNSALIYELCVLKQYAEPLLFAVGKEEPEYQEAKRLLKFLDYFLGVSSEDVPKNSILREFVGGSVFKV